MLGEQKVEVDAYDRIVVLKELAQRNNQSNKLTVLKSVSSTSPLHTLGLVSSRENWRKNSVQR